MAFDTLQVKAVKGLFTNTNGHRSIDGLCLSLLLCEWKNISNLGA